MRSAGLLAALLLVAVVGIHASNELEAKKRTRRVQILHLTDVHSWASGHKHEPEFDANYGDVVSLVTHLKATAAKDGEDLFVFNTGDIVDGTGLSDASELHGQFIVPIEQQMPYDAMCIGNHELYKNDTVDMLVDSGFISSWRGNYLNAQTRLFDTKELLGNTHTIITGKNAKTRLLVMGFIYNMDNSCEMVTVDTVESVLEQDWFAEALTIDTHAIVVLAHMGFDDKLVDKIHAALERRDRQKRPVVILTGHTHVRDMRYIEDRTIVVESGHYFDTVGHVTVEIGRRHGDVKLTHRFVNASVHEFEEWVHIPHKQFATNRGEFVRKEIVDARAALELDDVLGCSPDHYRRDLGLSNETALWRLYLEDVVPFGLFQPPHNSSMWTLASTGALRYDVYEGPFVRDDAFTVCPFRDVFHMIDNVDGEDLQGVLAYVTENADLVEHTTMRAPVPGLPPYASSPMPKAGEKYAFLFNTYDRPLMVAALKNVTHAEHAPVPTAFRHDNIDSSLLWEIYAQGKWPCAKQ